VPEESVAEIWRRYIKEIREKGMSSDTAILVVGGVIFFAGDLVAALDLIVIQHLAYRLDLMSFGGLALLLLGTALRVQARRTLGKYFSPVVRILPDHRLITYGIYQHIRHPGYLGELLLYLSIPLLLHSLYGFLVMILLMPLILYRIRVEEQVLDKRFGDKYSDYMKKTKRIVPYIY
jgi:protein-S-isoprenylcysteine O-methyltransferase Ste14